MTKAVMVRCYLFCLLTLALCSACGLVWADSPKASNALIKPSTIGVPSLVRHAIPALLDTVCDEDEEDILNEEVASVNRSSESASQKGDEEQSTLGHTGKETVHSEVVKDQSDLHPSSQTRTPDAPVPQPPVSPTNTTPSQPSAREGELGGSPSRNHNDQTERGGMVASHVEQKETERPETRHNGGSKSDNHQNAVHSGTSPTSNTKSETTMSESTQTAPKENGTQAARHADTS
ncbi:uncharacterized protein TM35_000451640, partial [Trypanosoma theileri]